jgi:uncharacterized protein (DUF1697 family)
MNNLKVIFEEMKFSDVQTYIQSGNVLFKTFEVCKIKLKNSIEKSISEILKKNIEIVILSFEDLKEIISNIPNDFGLEKDLFKYDILFLISPMSEEIRNKGLKFIKGNNKIFENDKAFFLKRSVLKDRDFDTSKLTSVWKNITIRNFNTTTKLFELMLKRNFD